MVETQGILMNIALVFPKINIYFELFTTLFTKKRQSMHIVALADLMVADSMFLETIVF